MQFSQVSLAFGDRDILKNVSVNLKAGTKAALTGANGAGKSTLMKILAGQLEPDSGQRIAEKGARIAYLPQSGIVHKGRTLREEADRAFAFGYELQARLDEIGDMLKSGSGSTKMLLEEQDRLLTALEDSGWNRRSALAEQVLVGLGFAHADLDRDCKEFSGGWQMRIALAKVLMAGPDILLLDEPTNYLDIEARYWLENFLKNFSGGFLLVSHDRYFLDVTIGEVYELFNGNLRCYPGNFTHYEKIRATELETLIAAYEKQQQEIRHLQEFVDRFRYKASKAAQAQERQKQLDKIIPIEIPESLKKIHFSFPQAPHSGQIVLDLAGITKSYDGGNNVLDNLCLQLCKNERLVVAGHNGAGKSTLLRIVAGIDSDFAGTVKLGSGVRTGYFSQDSAELIHGGATILDYLEQNAPLELVPRLRDMLGAFLFRGDDVFKTLDMLSGGEKSRIALLQLLLRPVNLLVLDEPTNHLDMHSKDVLLDALSSFGGTVMFVSHDRGFIEGLATKVLELKPGKFRLFPGDYVYYTERLAAEAAGLVPAAAAPSQTRLPAADTIVLAGKQPSAGKQSYAEQKKLQSERRRLEREEQRLMQEIEAAEAHKAGLEAQMAQPEVYSDGARCKAVQAQIATAEEQIAALNAQWEAVAAQLD